jgi:hypothetical protein
MVGMDAARDKCVVTVIDLTKYPCNNCPHKNVWMVMMTQSDDGGGTRKGGDDVDVWPWCKSFFGDMQ